MLRVLAVLCFEILRGTVDDTVDAIAAWLMRVGWTVALAL